MKNTYYKVRRKSDGYFMINRSYNILFKKEGDFFESIEDIMEVFQKIFLWNPGMFREKDKLLPDLEIVEMEINNKASYSLMFYLDEFE